MVRRKVAKSHIGSRSAPLSGYHPEAGSKPLFTSPKALSFHSPQLLFSGTMMVNRTATVSCRAPLLTRPRFLHGPAGIWDQATPRRWKMTAIAPVMWTVWAVLVALMLALKIYTGKLSRDEDDQLILDSAFDHVREQQAAIIAKVNKIEPISKLAMWLVVAMTVVVIAYYLFDFFSQFK